MADFVEREAVVMGVLGLTIVSPMVAQYADAVLHQIHQAPAADVAPVVRCAECKYWKCYGGSMKYYGECEGTSKEELWGEDDFCSHGERKENTDV